MQQNINPENDNDQSTETNNTMNYKILKIKGKPFWLNMSANKRKTYSRFKTQSQISHLDDLKFDKSFSKQQHHQSYEQNSCAQSVQSFNQNYDEDFESYKSTINRQNKSDGKLPFFQSSKSQHRNLNLQVSRLQISVLKTRQKRQNAMILKHKIVEKIQTNPKKNLKKQPIEKSQQKFSITREMFMNQNTWHLRNQNEKIIRKVQDLRKVIPVMISNSQQIFEQQVQIKELKQKINRILSVEYQFEMDENKLEIKIQQRQLEHSIKEMLSPKHDKRQPTVINDHTIVPPSKYAILREQLMNKIRLSCLRQEKSIKLSKKFQLYEEIIEKISAKQRIQSFSSLQNRKIFLEWDAKRLKNQIDLKIIQEKVQLQSLKDQIRIFDLQIANTNQILQNIKKYFVPQNKVQAKEISPIQTKPYTSLQQSQEIELVVEKNKAIKTFVFKKKKIDSFHYPTHNTSNTSQTNNSFILQKQQNPPKDFSLLPSPSLNKTNKSKLNSFDKHESLRKKRQLQKCNKNLNIRIKKSVFRNEGLSEELQELKL